MLSGHSLSIYAHFSGKKRTSLYISPEKSDHYFIQTRHNDLFCPLQSFFLENLQSNQVKRTPQESINEFIIQKLNPLLVVDFRLISAFLHV